MREVASIVERVKVSPALYRRHVSRLSDMGDDPSAYSADEQAFIQQQALDDAIARGFAGGGLRLSPQQAPPTYRPVLSFGGGTGVRFGAAPAPAPAPSGGFLSSLTPLQIGIAAAVVAAAVYFATRKKRR